MVSRTGEIKIKETTGTTKKERTKGKEKEKNRKKGKRTTKLEWKQKKITYTGNL